MSEASLALGIDAGGSSTRWVLRGPVGEVSRGRVGPLSGLAYLRPSGADAAEAAARIDELATAVRAAAEAWVAERTAAIGEIGLVVAGVTGLSEGDAAADTVRDALADALALPAQRVLVVDDVSLIYRSAFAPGEGVVVYAGTGSLAVHLTEDGVALRAGGHGYLIDDAGGGFWIGQRALQTVLRRADRRGSPATGALAEAIYEALGSRSWPDIRTRIYRGGRSEVAALVPAVRHAHARGDSDAVAIVNEAGEALARLADTLMARLGTLLPVALAGGATGLGAPLRQALSAALPARVELRVVARSPVEAAAHWAVEAMERVEG